MLDRGNATNKIVPRGCDERHKAASQKEPDYVVRGHEAFN